MAHDGGDVNTPSAPERTERVNEASKNLSKDTHEGHVAPGAARPESNKKSDKENYMSEPVNVYTNGMGGANNGMGFDGGLGGLLVGALLGRGGLGGIGAVGGDSVLGRSVTPTDLTASTNTVLNGQQHIQNVNGHQNILSAINSDTRDNLLATASLGDSLSTQVCNSESNIVNNIGSQAGSIRAEISEAKLQSATQFASLQLQSANDTFNLSRQMCDQSATTAAQFAALALQNCHDQNALQMQIAQCCCDMKEAVAGVTAAAVKDELDELRLTRALADNNQGNVQMINQIASSLSTLSQGLAALQAKA